MGSVLAGAGTQRVRSPGSGGLDCPPNRADDQHQPQHLTLHLSGNAIATHSPDAQHYSDHPGLPCQTGKFPLEELPPSFPFHRQQGSSFSEHDRGAGEHGAAGADPVTTRWLSRGNRTWWETSTAASEQVCPWCCGGGCALQPASALLPFCPPPRALEVGMEAMPQSQAADQLRAGYQLNHTRYPPQVPSS